jgi:phosphotriesterase-related protein
LKSPLQLLDVDDAIDEVMFFQQAGGKCIVDQTSIGMARDPVGLQRISRGTGIHVIMVTGHYIETSHPPDIKKRDENGVYELIMHEINEGVAWGVMPGMVGEIGLTWPPKDEERKCLRAAARASADSGLPLSIHPGGAPEAVLDAIRIVEDAGGDVSHTVMCHCDVRGLGIEGLIEVAKTGCYVELDTFGRESSWIWQKSSPHYWPNDAVRIDYVAELAQRGFEKQILISHDHAGKFLLHKWGGVGYDHMLVNIVPMMLHKGLSDALIMRLLVNNPAEMLTVR